MLFPTLAHTLARLHQLHRAIERERSSPASNTRLLRLQALLLRAKTRLDCALTPVAFGPVTVRVHGPRHVR